MGSGVTTVGTGSADAVPDVVLVELGAEASAQSVQDALARAQAGVQAAREALLAAGVAEQDLRTSQTSTWSEQHDGGPVRTTARLTLRCTVRDVAGSGQAVGAALAAAGDAARLDSTTFAVSDPAPFARAAREAAFADARTKAEQYATLAGLRLGDVMEIREDTGGPGPMPRLMAASAPVGSAFAVDPGTQEVTASVTVRWELV